jgi:hypothetical protein
MYIENLFHKKTCFIYYLENVKNAKINKEHMLGIRQECNITDSSITATLGSNPFLILPASCTFLRFHESFLRINTSSFWNT